jgi:hypothetical protein
MTHPALALLRAGSPSEAIAYLRQSGDHPSGLALLEAGFNDYAEVVLAGVAPTPRQDAPGGPPAAEQYTTAGDTRKGAGGTFSSKETAYQGRAA